MDSLDPRKQKKKQRRSRKKEHRRARVPKVLPKAKDPQPQVAKDLPPLQARDLHLRVVKDPPQQERVDQQQVGRLARLEKERKVAPGAALERPSQL